MVARTVIALFAFLTLTCAQQDSLWVDVTPIETETEEPEVEKRYTPELLEELQSVKDNAILLYTEFTARAGADLKMFIRNISGLTADVEKTLSWGLLDSAPEDCRIQFHKRLKKIEYDAHRAASFSSENHHKFFRGHMVVFRMHINKSEDYIRKCENTIKTCGIACETISKVARWRRLAKKEIDRTLDDIQHSRRSYHDLLIHAHRKLIKLRKEADIRAKTAVQELQECAKGANST